LVVWNMNMIFPYFSHHIGNVIIPTDEVIFFRGVETTNQTGFSVPKQVGRNPDFCFSGSNPRVFTSFFTKCFTEAR